LDFCVYNKNFVFQTNFQLKRKYLNGFGYQERIMSGGSIVGQTLDGKYRIESEIGKGGMGTVYLATHVGTERPVALKIIASEFMQRIEFVERFRREARAAGRLRHPNVVDVTDFGFSKTPNGEVAYLVMEYLDGCTLGEVLEEEKQLPLSWTLDILEQVCSAVQEAHEQGIIHRDLKPDNIWLEPNQRGGYTVKVLDFGIAKLEEQIGGASAKEQLEVSIAPNKNLSARATIAEQTQPNTIADNRNLTAVSESATVAQFAGNDLEAGTLIQSKEVDLESGTAIFPIAPVSPSTKDENVGTKLISERIETNEQRGKAPATAELTRVGAVLGTPLYMSPEQCRGERLTPQSDIYSLGVIAYQMLSGKTPFSGDYLDVMEAHKETAPPLLDAKKVRKKVKGVINSALSKTIESRPPTAQAFGAKLRAESEGIGTLLRRALTIYSEHLPKFILLTLLIFSPFLIVTGLKLLVDIFYAAGIFDRYNISTLNAILVLPVTFVGIFCGQLFTGTATWFVMQFLAVPLRPLDLRTALTTTKKKWKRLLGTGLLSTALTFLGLLACGIGFPILSVLFVLVAPVVMMEDLRGFAALKRSKTLVLRSLRTTVASVFIMFIVPLIFGAFVGLFVAATVKTFGDIKEKIAVRNNAPQTADKTSQTAPETTNIEIKNGEIKIDSDDGKPAAEKSEAEKQDKIFRETLREGMTTILMLPIQILLVPLSSIIVALLYLKTRRVGGESMQDLLAQFEAADQPRTNWQRRVQARLEQSGKHTSKT
jgi:serine/threonine protein kinase